jgi:hypothetical protein
VPPKADKSVFLFFEFYLASAFAENEPINKNILDQWGEKAEKEAWQAASTATARTRIIVPLLRKQEEFWWWSSKDDGKKFNMPPLLKDIKDVCDASEPSSAIGKLIARAKEAEPV